VSSSSRKCVANGICVLIFEQRWWLDGGKEACGACRDRSEADRATGVCSTPAVVETFIQAHLIDLNIGAPPVGAHYCVGVRLTQIILREETALPGVIFIA